MSPGGNEGKAGYGNSPVTEGEDRHETETGWACAAESRQRIDRNATTSAESIGEAAPERAIEERYGVIQRRQFGGQAAPGGLRRSAVGRITGSTLKNARAAGCRHFEREDVIDAVLLFRFDGPRETLQHGTGHQDREQVNGEARQGCHSADVDSDGTVFRVLQSSPAG